MKRVWIPFILAAVAVVPGAGARTQITAGRPEGKEASDQQVLLHKHTRVLLAQARAEGQRTISVVIAAEDGESSRVADGVIGLGGRIRFRDDEIGYLRAFVPTDSVEPLAAKEGVLRLDVDVSTGLLRPEENQLGTSAKRSFYSPDAHTPATNPYLPTHVMGAPQFVAGHPTFDGRGVVIGIIEPGVDLLLPELQEGTTLDGQPARKILDFVSTSDPESGDPMWVSLDPVRAERNGAIVWHGETYSASQAGAYRIGQLDERCTLPCWNDDVNRDGNPPGASRSFGVLVDPRKRVVWVDVNQNRSFADEMPLRSYGERFDIGVFRPMGRTPREKAPFAVQLSEDANHVHFNLDASHGTMVASSAAGGSFFGGEMNGVAPGAQIVLLQFGHLNYMGALIEALVRGFRDPRVDLVTCSCAAYTDLNDGRSLVLDVVMERLIARFRKPFTGSGGNGPWMNLVHSPGASSGALAIGGYVDRDTFAANIGIDVARNDYLAAYARGPREDGGLQPFVVAPTFALAGDSVWAPAQKKPYVLPPGYRIGGGTSQAAPMAAGVLALLVSAAKQQGIPHDTDRLRFAVATGARFLGEYGAYEQGNGLIQVGPAWEALQRMADAAPMRIITRAPVNTKLSPLLRTPGMGEGLYEREGWRVGMQATREITLTRTSGPDSTVDYDLRWVGNDGTFRSAAIMYLPLNRPVELPVAVHARAPGVHSAILNLMDRKTHTVAHQVLHTIVVAEPLDATNQFTLTRTLPLSVGEVESIFVHVPEGTSVLRAAVSTARGIVNLEGMFSPSGGSSKRYPVLHRRPPGKAPPGHDAWLTVENPAPGVWQIQISDVRESAGDAEEGTLLPTEAQLTISAYAATLSADERGRLAMTNKMARFDGGVTSLGLGVLLQSELALSRMSPQIVRDVEVPMGTEQLFVRVERVSTLAADVDLYALLCQTPTSCVPMIVRVGLSSDEEILIPRPMPGRWVIVVDPAQVPVDGARITYTELLTHPRFGSVHIAAADAEGPAETWAVTTDRRQSDEDKRLALLAAAMTKDVAAHRPVNGGRLPALAPPGGFVLIETPAVLGKVIVKAGVADD